MRMRRCDAGRIARWSTTRQTEHHGDDVCGGSCVDAGRISGNISTCRKSTGWEFFVPARTLIGVKLLKNLEIFCFKRQWKLDKMSYFSEGITNDLFAMRSHFEIIFIFYLETDSGTFSGHSEWSQNQWQICGSACTLLCRDIHHLYLTLFHLMRMMETHLLSHGNK